MSYYFEITILAEICIKMRYFYLKIRPALGALHPEPLASASAFGI